MNWEWLALYMTIPADYCRHLGGLHWSADGAAVDNDRGGTFVFKQEFDLFLEGFTSQRPPIHFGFILHLMHLLAKAEPARLLDPTYDGERASDAIVIPAAPVHELLRRAQIAQRLGQTFADTGRPWRNAGAFAGTFCKGNFPSVPDPGQWRTSDNHWIAMLGVPVGQGEVPPLSPVEFEQQFTNLISALTVETLIHWFRHGRGPVPAAKEIVQVLEDSRPRTLGHVMANLAQRKRLAGAVPFVSQLVSALALPPRRLADQELPIGGYVDVATRGQPEHILPSQFAVDDLEFVRRFAQHELLYFRREEPHAQLKEELLIVLDQGVRAWGDVRLILSAAVFALAKRAEARRTPFRLAVTCFEGRIVDPLDSDDDELGTLLEASDLTLHPGLALERVLAEPSEVARDVVLLTHPRSLREPEVAAAARAACGETRLFALSVADDGQAQLDELRQGVPVAVRQFRVTATLAPPPPETFEPHPDALPPFTGAVEPIGFPFRTGVGGPIQHLAFDYSGDWLLIGGPKGMLHAAHVRSGEVETWPRGFDGQELLTQVSVILGVAGGFVVGGRIGSKLVAAHYDLSARQVKLHRLGVLESEAWKWHYFLEQHALVVRAGEVCASIDLATGAHGNQRVEEAKDRSKGRWPAPGLYVGTRAQPSTWQPMLFVDTIGTISLRGLLQVWKPFIPMADGQAVLSKDRKVWSAQCNGTLLALEVSDLAASQPVLHLYRGQRGQGLGELRMRAESNRFMLAPTGQRLAVQSGTSRVAVHDLAGGLAAIYTSPLARWHSGLQVQRGDRWLTVEVGKFVHFFRWDGGRLLHRQTRGSKDMLLKEELAGTPLYGTGVPAIWPGTTDNAYLRERFVSIVRGGLRVAVDQHSQLAVIDVEDRLVCMFYIFREKWAAWLPDGTRLGPATITGGPETPNAVDRIGRTLLAASSRAGTIEDR